MAKYVSDSTAPIITILTENILVAIPDLQDDYAAPSDKVQVSTAAAAAAVKISKQDTPTLLAGTNETRDVLADTSKNTVRKSPPGRVSTFLLIPQVFVAISTKAIERGRGGHAHQFSIFVNSKCKRRWIGANEVSSIGTDPLLDDRDAPVKQLCQTFTSGRVVLHSRYEALQLRQL